MSEVGQTVSLCQCDYWDFLEGKSVLNFAPFMSKEIREFFIRLVNVLVVGIPRLDLELSCLENGVDFTCDLLAFRFTFSGSSNVVNVDECTELFSCFRVQSLWDFLLLPAKFMVKCVLGPLIPSFFFIFFEIKLVFEPLSNIARTSTKFPSLSVILTCYTGQRSGTFLSPWTLWLLASGLVPVQ